MSYNQYKSEEDIAPKYLSCACFNGDSGVKKGSYFTKGKLPRETNKVKTSLHRKSFQAKHVSFYGPNIIHRNALQVPFDCATTLERITDSLRIRSVAASFNEDKSQIICTTKQYLVYSIDLYGGSDPDKTTIVEVRKMQGKTFGFSQERMAIENAARGLGGDNTVKTSFGPPSMKIPADILSLCDGPTTGDLECMLESTVDELHNRCARDATLLALEHLVSITTPDNNFSKTATTVANLILVENTSMIRDMIVHFIAKDANNTDHDILDEQIINSCLSILSNSMSLLLRDKSDVLGDDEQWFTETLVPTLVEHVKAYRYTHNAYLAMKCICFLIRVSSLARNKIGESDTIDVIKCAQDYGKAQHYKLEKEAGLALRELCCM